MHGHALEAYGATFWTEDDFESMSGSGSFFSSFLKLPSVVSSMWATALHTSRIRPKSVAASGLVQHARGHVRHLPQPSRRVLRGSRKRAPGPQTPTARPCRARVRSRDATQAQRHTSQTRAAQERPRACQRLAER